MSLTTSLNNKYLVTLRGSIQGITVMGFHKITGDESEDKATMFGMTISSKMNMGSGVLVVNSNEDWTPELLEVYLRSLSQAELKKFIKDATP